jgi:hypothetical protein
MKHKRYIWPSKDEGSESVSHRKVADMGRGCGLSDGLENGRRYQLMLVISILAFMAALYGMGVAKYLRLDKESCNIVSL